MLLTGKSEVPFAGPRSSEEFNAWAESIVKDLYHIYDMAEEQGLDLPRRYMALAHENLFLQRKIEQLEGSLQALYESYPTLHRSFSDASGLSFSSTPAHVDTGFGIASAALRSQVSKIYLKDSSGRPRLPVEAEVFAYVSDEPIPMPSEGAPNFGTSVLLEDNTSHLRQSIDGIEGNFWHVELVRGGDVEDVYIAVHVRLPAVYAHPLANSLIIRPLPSYSMELLDVRMRGAGSWFQPNTMPTEPVGGVRDMRLLFSEADVAEFIVYFRQPFWFNRDGDRIFSVGLRDLGLELVRFHRESSLTIPFDLPDPASSFEEVRGITLHYAPYSIQDSSLTELRLLDEHGNPLDLYEQPQALTRRVYVELTFHSQDTSPLIEAITLEYEYA